MIQIWTSDLSIGKRRPECNDDTTYLFCEQKFSNDKKGELYIGAIFNVNI